MHTPHQEVRLGYKSWTQVRDYLQGKDTLLIPLGSTEQHGPGCPVLADALIAEHLALEVGAATGVWVGPTIPVGDSLIHLDFPGTISLRPTTLISLIRDYIASLHKSGFRRYLIVNGHGDNAGPIFSAMSELGEELNDLRYYVQDFWDFPAFREQMLKYFGDSVGGHADASDAAILMAIDNSLVRIDRLDSGSASVDYRISRNLVNQLYTSSGSGVINSDQRLANQDIGEILIREAVAGYTRLLSTLMA